MPVPNLKIFLSLATIRPFSFRSLNDELQKLLNAVRLFVKSEMNHLHIDPSCSNTPIPHIYVSRFNLWSLSRGENVQVACYDSGSTVRVGMNVCDGQIIQTKAGLKNDLVTFRRQD